MEFAMARSKKSSLSSTEKGKTSLTSRRVPRGAGSAIAHLSAPKKPCEDTFSLVEPQINAEGVHIWPFNAACPVDVLFMNTHDRQRVLMNRHRYFEILYLCSGSGVCNIQDRFLPFQEGGLAVIGSTLYHFRVERDQALLANSDESMVSISHQVGFCDQSYFGTVFRKILGMPPAAYRRRAREGCGAGQGQENHIGPITIADNPARAV
jgi:AraC-like DNA-binding protein